MVAGSGADAAPHFRVFNPVLQSEKFDPDGGYIRRWMPELATGLIHQPCSATPLQRKARAWNWAPPIQIIDHKFGRARALQAYATQRPT